MSFQVVPNGGILHNDYLDNLRTMALVALDRGNMKLPAEVIEYITSLEQHYMNHEQKWRKEAAEELWALRREDMAKADMEAGEG